MAKDKKSSVEERLEKLERNKSRDQIARERAEKLEKLKNTPINFKPDDPTRAHKSKKQILAEQEAELAEKEDVNKFLAERKKKKETEDAATKEKEIIPDKPVKKGRPKKVE